MKIRGDCCAKTEAGIECDKNHQNEEKQMLWLGHSSSFRDLKDALTKRFSYRRIRFKR